MDQEKMADELKRLLEKLETLDPTTEDYSTAVKNYHELMKTLHEELEACDSDLDHSLKRELDKSRLELNKLEEKNRNRQATVDAILSVVKIGLSIVGTIGAIVVTGSLEESTILSQKCFGLVRGLMPGIK